MPILLSMSFGAHGRLCVSVEWQWNGWALWQRLPGFTLPLAEHEGSTFLLHGLSVHSLNAFPINILFGIFKFTKKMKEFYSNTYQTHLLDSMVNILLGLLYHISIQKRKSIQPPFFIHFKVAVFRALHLCKLQHAHHWLEFSISLWFFFSQIEFTYTKCTG